MREKERKVLGSDLSILRDEIRIVLQKKKKKIKEREGKCQEEKINLYNQWMHAMYNALNV